MDSRVLLYRKRRDNRLKRRGIRLDADEEEEEKKSHGNTKLPYGLAKGEGISTKGMMPREVWEALAGKGYTPAGAYKGLKEGKHGKDLREKKPRATRKPKASVATPARSLLEIEAEIESETKKRGNLNSSISMCRHQYDDIKSGRRTFAWFPKDVFGPEAGTTTVTSANREDILQKYTDAIEILQSQIDECTSKIESAKKEKRRAKKVAPQERPNGATMSKEDFAKKRDEWDYANRKIAALENKISKRERKVTDAEYSLIGAKKRKEEIEKTGAKSVEELQDMLSELKDQKKDYRHFAGIVQYADWYGMDGGYAEAEKELAEVREKTEKLNKKDKESLEYYKSEASVFHDIVREHFPDFDSCETTRDVSERLEAVAKFTSKVSFEKVDVAVAKNNAGAVEKMLTKYPVLQGKLGGISASSLSANAYAQSVTGGGIKLNYTYFGDRDTLVELIERDEKSGWHPDGLGENSVIIHEYGHQIDNCLSAAITGDSSSVHAASDMIFEKIRNKLGISDYELKEKVSGYAVKNSSPANMEWFAECWSEYICSQNPRDIAQMVGKEVEALLKEHLN